jgi:hypothetical protein
MSMTITVDLGPVRVAYDLLEDAGAAEVMAAVEMMRALLRSSRFRALVLATREFTSDDPFDIDVSGPEPADGTSDGAQTGGVAAVGLSTAPAQSPSVYKFVGVRMSDRGELRAISSSGKYAKYGWALGALRDEYLRRAGVSAEAVNSLAPGGQIMHNPVELQIDSSGSRFVDAAQ